MKAILTDFGSTFTKVMLIDLKKEEILRRSNSPSTVQTDVAIGLQRALNDIGLKLTDLKQQRFNHRLACSSAAGGLRMVVIGLVPQLTVEAAKKAAFGAGANIIGTYSYELTTDEAQRIEKQKPDIIILAGGSDGGERKTVLHNAELLSKIKITSPIIISCNKTISEKVKKTLSKTGKITRVSENVMPELWKLNIEPVKREIRKVFLERIVKAKGLEEVRRYFDVLIPTPSATMKAAELTAMGVKDQEGLGDLLTVEVGGATTNVYSVSEGITKQRKRILRGFKEPYVKRTVEGDLGLRYNAKSIIEKIGDREFQALLYDEGYRGSPDVYGKAHRLSESVEIISTTAEDRIFDDALSRVAVRIAVQRHSGKLIEMRLPGGISYIQEGKDLGDVKNIIGTGGGVVYAKNPKQILSEALFNPSESFILRPKNSQLFTDSDYVMWAMGLLANVSPSVAYSIIRNSLRLL